MIIGIDQAKRSTAAVCIDMEGNLVDYLLVNPPSEIDGVELLRYQWCLLEAFVGRYETDLKGVALEGLSFNSVGSGKDFLGAIFWMIQLMLYQSFPKIPVGSIPALSWRSKVISKEERKVIAVLKSKDAIKKATVAKLPFEVKVQFENYVRESGIKKEAVFDLCDAFFIAQYRLSLE